MDAGEEDVVAGAVVDGFPRTTLQVGLPPAPALLPHAAHGTLKQAPQDRKNVHCMLRAVMQMRFSV